MRVTFTEEQKQLVALALLGLVAEVGGSNKEHVTEKQFEFFANKLDSLGKVLDTEHRDIQKDVAEIEKILKKFKF